MNLANTFKTRLEVGTYLYHLSNSSQEYLTSNYNKQESSAWFFVDNRTGNTDQSIMNEIDELYPAKNTQLMNYLKNKGGSNLKNYGRYVHVYKVNQPIDLLHTFDQRLVVSFGFHFQPVYNVR